jgi:hypothetical protein
MNQLLKIFIKETVEEIVQEVTARKGPRTGGFEFDSMVIEKIYQRAIKAKKELEKMAGDKKEKVILNKRARFEILNPITGKNTYVLFQFYLDPNPESETGIYEPAKKQIGLNVNDLDLNDAKNLWFKGTINHELTHYFNLAYHPQDSEEADSKEKDSKDYEKYVRKPYEKSAFIGGTLVKAMQLEAEQIADQIKNGDLAAKIAGESLVRKPHRLYEKLRNTKNFATLINIYMKDPQSRLMKKLNLAAYEIIQRTIVPALHLIEI